MTTNVFFFSLLIISFFCYCAQSSNERLAYSGLFEVEDLEREDFSEEEKENILKKTIELIKDEFSSTFSEKKQQLRFTSLQSIEKRLLYYTYEKTDTNSRNLMGYKRNSQGQAISTEEYIFARTYLLKLIFHHKNENENDSKQRGDDDHDNNNNNEDVIIAENIIFAEEKFKYIEKNETNDNDHHNHDKNYDKKNERNDDDNDDNNENDYFLHTVKVWYDIDKEYFLISHFFSPISNHNPHHHNDDDEKKEEAEMMMTEHKINHLNLISYNIWNFNDHWEDRASLIISAINDVAGDVIAFQEVRYDIVREYKYKNVYHKTVKRFQVDELKETFHKIDSINEWNYVYTPAMSYLEIDRGGFRTDEGLAIFSKYPILDSSHLLLSRNFADSDDVHQRILQRALIHTPVGNITLFNSHFALSESAQHRGVLEIWDWIQQFPLPQILVGDLNSEPSSTTIRFLLGKEELRGMKGDFVDLWETFSGFEDDVNGYTFLTWEKKKRIDFILFRGNFENLEYLPKLIGCEGILHPEGISNNEDSHLYASDHCGLMVNFLEKKNVY